MITEHDIIRLVSWYQEHRRDLPWRRTNDPYFIWISEIMLQQTRVDAVILYYERFIKVLPTLQSLAEVSLEELYKLWEGLGYYRRARNLKQCAMYLVEHNKHTLPSSYEELIKLPGIGSYTAGAIASIAFGKKEAAVDGNVLRVFSRVFLEERDISSVSLRKEYEQIISSMMNFGPPRDITEGLIELGATVCLPNGTPLCESCPWKLICRAHQTNQELRYPKKKKKKERKLVYKTVLIFVYQGQIYLHKRREEGLLAGLNEFYLLDRIYFDEELQEYFDLHSISYRDVLSLGQKKHLFSHEEWRMMGYLVFLTQPLFDEEYFLVSVDDIVSKLMIPVVFQKYFQKVLNFSRESKF